MKHRSAAGCNCAPYPEWLSKSAVLAVGRQAQRVAEVRVSDVDAMIAHPKLLIAKLHHERFDAFSEAMEPTQGLTPLLTPGGTGTKTGRQLDHIGEGPI
jgi:hypothetical protein